MSAESLTSNYATPLSVCHAKGHDAQTAYIIDSHGIVLVSALLYKLRVNGTPSQPFSLLNKISISAETGLQEFEVSGIPEFSIVGDNENVWLSGGWRLFSEGAGPGGVLAPYFPTLHHFDGNLNYIRSYGLMATDEIRNPPNSVVPLYQCALTLSLGGSFIRPWARFSNSTSNVYELDIFNSPIVEERQDFTLIDPIYTRLQVPPILDRVFGDNAAMYSRSVAGLVRSTAIGGSTFQAGTTLPSFIRSTQCGGARVLTLRSTSSGFGEQNIETRRMTDLTTDLSVDGNAAISSLLGFPPTDPFILRSIGGI